MATASWHKLSAKDRKQWEADWKSNNTNPLTSNFKTAEHFYYTNHPEATPEYGYVPYNELSPDQKARAEKEWKRNNSLPHTSNFDSVEDHYYADNPASKPRPKKVKPKQPAGEKTTGKTTKTKTDEVLESLPLQNKFLDFSTMTYNAAIYLISPQHYSKMMNENIKDVSKMDLIIQSGGINDKGTKGNFGARRNPHFTEDFFLDNIQFESLISGTSVNAPHNSFSLNFTITEPMGLTLLERLYGAINDYNACLGITEPGLLTQTYVMVIRFYGYDEDGKPITGADLEKNSDQKAFSEKWIPFIFKNITFRLEADKVVYSCQAVPPGTQIGNSQVHGTIPFNIGLQGQTLGNLLTGKTQGKLPGDVVAKGLKDALNKHQEGLAKCGKYTYPDVYDFEFEGGDAGNLALAKLVGPGTPLIKGSGMPSGSDPASTIKQQTGKSKTNKEIKWYGVNAGIKIMTFLDLVIRSSTYITSQFKQEKDPNKENTTVWKRVDPEKPLKWFKIRPRIEFLPYDEARRNFSYKITYVISTYEVYTVDSENFVPATCFPIHKEYDYWFTGKNTDVLNFSQDFNFLYYTSFGASHAADPAGNKPKQANARLAQRAYRNRVQQSAQGNQEGNMGEQGANIASQLYSPADQASVEIDILGDPDWIGQSELFYAAKETNKRSPTLPDGSLNYDMAEIFFAINFNTVVDYNRETGIADVTLKNDARDPTANKGGVSQYSYVYRANKMITELTEGKFTQRLQGTLMYIPEECITGKKKKEETKKEKTEAKPKKKKTEKKACNPLDPSTYPATTKGGKGNTPKPNKAGSNSGRVNSSICDRITAGKQSPDKTPVQKRT